MKKNAYGYNMLKPGTTDNFSLTNVFDPETGLVDSVIGLSDAGCQAAERGLRPERARLGAPCCL